MYIRTKSNPITRMVNMNHFAEIGVVHEDENKWCVSAIFSDGEHYICLESYETEAAAEAVVDAIWEAILLGETTFEMP